MRKPYLVSVAVAGTMLVALLSSSVVSHFGSATAQTQVISEDAVGTEGIIKVKSLDVREEVSKNQDIELTAEGRDDGIVFRAINKSDRESELGVDAWKIYINGAVFDIRPPTILASDSRIVAAAGASDVLEFSINDYMEEFEEYPGRYNVTLLGFDVEQMMTQEEENEENGIEVEREDLAIYKVNAQMVVGYDEDVIKSKDGSILKATNTRLAIDGNNPFVIENDEKRTIVLSVVNNNDYPVSGLVKYIGYSVMNAEVTRAVGTDSVREYLNNECMIMKPGESKEIRTYIFGKDIPPLGGEGKSLSNKMDDDSSIRPGTYIFEVEGGTMPCIMHEDERIPGMTFESMVALEVR